jgi:hypothetical protein
MNNNRVLSTWGTPYDGEVAEDVFLIIYKYIESEKNYLFFIIPNFFHILSECGYIFRNN